jgi:hypothetical protein
VTPLDGCESMVDVAARKKVVITARRFDEHEAELTSYFLSALARSILDGHVRDLNRPGDHVATAFRAATNMQEVRMLSAEVGLGHPGSEGLITEEHVALADQVLRRIAMGFVQGDPNILGHLRDALRLFDGTSRAEPARQERQAQALRVIERLEAEAVLADDIAMHHAFVALVRIDPAFAKLERDRWGERESNCQPIGTIWGAWRQARPGKASGLRARAALLVDLARECGAFDMNRTDDRARQINAVCKSAADAVASGRRPRKKL